MFWRSIGQLRPLHMGFLAFMVIFSSISLCVSALGYGFNKTHIKARHENLETLAQYALSLIDVQKHSTLVNSHYDRASHKALLAPLVHLHKQMPTVSYIYTMTLSNDRIHFVLDTSDDPEMNPEAKENTSSYMEEYINYSESPKWLASLKQGKTYIDHTISEDEFGQWVSVSVPQMNDKGQLEFWLGMDFDAKDYMREENAVLIKVVIIISFGFVLSVLVGFMVARTQDTIQKLQDSQRRQAITDPLTGAYNRRYLKGLAEKLWLKFRTIRASYAVLIMDIDHFKKINDTFGHDAGDQCLIGLVALLSKTLRTEDHLIRMGGEEFLVILPHFSDEASLYQAADRIRNSIERNRITLEDGTTLQISVSIGAVVSQQQDKSVEGSIQRADKLLYLAKESGRNRVITPQQAN